MRAVTKSFKVYQFEELSEKVQDEVLYRFETSYANEAAQKVLTAFGCCCKCIGITFFEKNEIIDNWVKFQAQYEYRADGVDTLTAHAPDERELIAIAKKLEALQAQLNVATTGTTLKARLSIVEYPEDDEPDTSIEHQCDAEHIGDRLAQVLEDLLDILRVRMVSVEVPQVGRRH